MLRQAVGGLLLSLVLTPGCALAQDITSNLIGYWKMNEGTGTTVDDSSPNANTCTLNNQYVWAPAIAPPNLAPSVELQSAGEGNLSCGTDTSLLVAGTQLTLTAWVRLATSADFTTIVSLDDGISSMTYRLLLNAARTTLRLQSSIGLIDTESDAFSALALTTWHHVGVTANTTTDTVTFYLNGTQTGNAITTTGTFVDDTAPEFKIGWSIAGSYFLNGWVDEVRVYRRALTATDMAAVYAFTDAPAAVGRRRIFIY